MKKLMITLALATVAFASSPAFAGKTYGDERCKSPLKNGVVCMAYMEPTTLGELLGHSMPFKTFVEVNAKLRANASKVSPQTPIPANQYYITRIR